MREHNPDVPVYIYEGAGHGFNNDSPERYNEEAAYLLARYRSRAGEAVQALKFIDDFSSSYLDEFGERPPVRFGELRAAIAAGVAV